MSLPKVVKKQASKRLQQIVNKIGIAFMTLEDGISEALELGRKEGFTDMEIGDMIRAEFKRINRPRMTLSRYLPVTAKHMEKARPKSDFGNILLPNKPVVTNKILSSTDTTTSTITTKLEQQQKPGKFNQAPEDYDINQIQDYDTEYLRDIVQSQHDKIAAVAKAKADKDFIERQNFFNRTEQDREKEREILKKISVDEIKAWKVGDYEETFCRYALMKTIEERYRFKDNAERYEKISKSYRQDIDILLRRFKLCQLCFFGCGPRDSKGNKRKFVKGVYDRGITTDYDLGWVCAKCKADEVRLNKEMGPILSKMFMK